MLIKEMLIKEDHLHFAYKVYEHFHNNPNSYSYMDEHLQLMAVPDNYRVGHVNIYEAGVFLFTLTDVFKQPCVVSEEIGHFLADHNMYMSKLPESYSKPIELVTEFFDEGAARLSTIGDAYEAGLKPEQNEKFRQELHLIIEMLARATQVI